ncbi:hypothetical protein [Hyphomicrobium sp. CS1BSMeth3]|uniref:hypothetical protein n=1 Tax=Hyphomicrobium sp. CS1BSMeth3 TaxID=1892844 RepID=UPI001160204A|nr:hypothetical protein [Hyphomicrobium sp. CS1BSMeth3]
MPYRRSSLLIASVATISIFVTVPSTASAEVAPEKAQSAHLDQATVRKVIGGITTESREGYATSSNRAIAVMVIDQLGYHSIRRVRSSVSRHHPRSRAKGLRSRLHLVPRGNAAVPHLDRNIHKYGEIDQGQGKEIEALGRFPDGRSTNKAVVYV